VLAPRLSGAKAQTKIRKFLVAPARKIMQLALLSESAVTLVDATRWGWSGYKSQKWPPNVWCCRHTYMYDGLNARTAGELVIIMKGVLARPFS